MRRRRVPGSRNVAATQVTACDPAQTKELTLSDEHLGGFQPLSLLLGGQLRRQKPAGRAAASPIRDTHHLPLFHFTEQTPSELQTSHVYYLVLKYLCVFFCFLTLRHGFIEWEAGKRERERTKQR